MIFPKIRERPKSTTTTKTSSSVVAISELGLLFALILSTSWTSSQSQCSDPCEAMASYYVTENNNLSFIAQLFNVGNRTTILPYNSLSNEDSIIKDTRVNVPFTCGCLRDEIPSHSFNYTTVAGDTYGVIATTLYKNLTSVNDLRKFNSYSDNGIPANAPVSVTVNCTCGNRDISGDYGFFLTYPVRQGDNMSLVLQRLGAPSMDLVQRYNEGKDVNRAGELIFIPVRDPNLSFRPLPSSKGISAGIIAGTTVAGVVVVFLVLFFYFGVYRRKKEKKASLLQFGFKDSSLQNQQGASPGLTGITVDKSVEFSYEELSKATDDFSMANKIGQGGFGAVYYAELRGEKAAIKKMDMEASREFLAELKVLTHVHHLNLVRLIGFCTEKSLFLVYEFIENGNLSQHLRGAGREPLPWSARVQIALDSARGLEYIHEHTVPVYIHRDIKSANILIDKNFRAKVADFGLTKLTQVGNSSMGTRTRLVGTFGYMPPEYAQYGDVSPKVDVFAFGVVLYELISAKEAVVKTGESIAESKGLVSLFENALNEPDPREYLRKLVDPRLSDNYPIDSVHKLAQLAKACTQENPLLRPSMRSIVVALMTLSSSTEDWDVGTFYDNQALVNLMSGR